MRCALGSAGSWRRETGSATGAGGFLRTPRQRHRHVAGAAEQTIVLEAAFTATIRDRNDMIRLPLRARGAPHAACGAISRGWLRSRPLTMGLHHIEAADLTGSLVALLDLLPDVPRAASDLPFMNARVAAERAPRRMHTAAAPSADGLTGLIPIGFSPLLGRHDTGAAGAHGGKYREEGGGAIGGGGTREGTEGTKKIYNEGTKATETNEGKMLPVIRPRCVPADAGGWPGASSSYVLVAPVPSL